LKWREGIEVDWNLLNSVIDSFVQIGTVSNVKIKLNQGNLKWTGNLNLIEYEEYFESKFL